MPKTGVMMVHGTMGSPREFDGLAAALQGEGFLTRQACLPGHGDDPRHSLIDVCAEQIVAHCRDEYIAFAETCDQVVLLGHSLGGICSLVLASQQPEKLGGVISLAAPFEHAYSVNYTHGLLQANLSTLGIGALYVHQYHTGFKKPAFKPWWFPKLQAESARMFHILQAGLPQIEAPVTLAHSPFDLIVPYAEMGKLADAINQPHRVKTYTLRHCGHQVFPNSRGKRFATELILHTLRQWQPVATEPMLLPKAYAEIA